MGTWGYRSYEGDAAQDFISKLTDETLWAMVRNLKPKYASLTTEDKHVFLGAVMYYIHQLHHFPRSSTIRFSIKCAKDILADDDFCGSFRNPDSKRILLSAEIAELEDIIDMDKRAVKSKKTKVKKKTKPKAKAKKKR